MNKVILIGRLTRDPEIRTAQDGLTIARYSLAIDRQTKEKQADFFRCVTFGKKRRICRALSEKGNKSCRNRQTTVGKLYGQRRPKGLYGGSRHRES